MCDKCENSVVPASGTVHRRNFLKFAGAALAGLTLSGRGFAADPDAPPPKPENVLTPDQALERLMAGNQRYVDGVTRRHNFDDGRSALTHGQNPFAGILSCADSRVAPEFAFDSGRGDLFVVRVAGNFAGEDATASFEYTVKFLKTPLLMVLGHQSCGAVDATIKTVKDGAKFPGHIPELVKQLKPAVIAAEADPHPDLLAASIRQNVIMTVERLKSDPPILNRWVEEKKLKIVGGVYSLATGRIELVA